MNLSIRRSQTILIRLVNPAQTTHRYTVLQSLKALYDNGDTQTDNNSVISKACNTLQKPHSVMVIRIHQKFKQRLNKPNEYQKSLQNFTSGSERCGVTGTENQPGIQYSKLKYTGCPLAMASNKREITILNKNRDQKFEFEIKEQKDKNGSGSYLQLNLFILLFTNILEFLVSVNHVFMYYFCLFFRNLQRGLTVNLLIRYIGKRAISLKIQ